jgi:hypothetical protein
MDRNRGTKQIVLIILAICFLLAAVTLYAYAVV